MLTVTPTQPVTMPPSKSGTVTLMKEVNIYVQENTILSP